MKIETLKLTRVHISDKDKAGNAYVTKTGKNPGKPYWKVGIQVDKPEYKDKWLSGFIWNQDDPMFQWTAGQQITVAIEQNGAWLNFKRPNQDDKLEMRIKDLEAKVEALTEFIKGGKNDIADKMPELKGEPVEPEEELPF